MKIAINICDLNKIICIIDTGQSDSNRFMREIEVISCFLEVTTSIVK